MTGIRKFQHTQNSATFTSLVLKDTKAKWPTVYIFGSKTKKNVNALTDVMKWRIFFKVFKSKYLDSLFSHVSIFIYFFFLYVVLLKKIQLIKSLVIKVQIQIHWKIKIDRRVI